MGCRPIVVVEDDDDIRESFRDVLEAEGHTVVTARNGRDALALLERLGGQACLVLLDLMMPVMNGWQFLDRLHANRQLRSTPVVVLSAAAIGNESAERVLGKPIDVDKLLEAVRDYC